MMRIQYLSTFRDYCFSARAVSKPLRFRRSPASVRNLTEREDSSQYRHLAGSKVKTYMQNLPGRGMRD
jgi:hypothetical protein